MPGMSPLKNLHVFEAPPRLMDKLAAKDSPNNITSLLVTPDIKVRTYSSQRSSTKAKNVRYCSWLVSPKVPLSTLGC